MYACMRTTMNLSGDVRRILQAESARRKTPMTVLMENAVRSAYGSASAKTRRRQVVRRNGILVAARLPDERAVTDARVREILQDMEW